MRRRLPWVAWALSSVIAAWLLWMTLRPNRIVAADLAPLTEPAGKQGIPAHLLIDFAGNIAVFVPLGATLALALRDKALGRRLLWATLVGAGLSLAIELIQINVPSRVAAVDDWLLNTLGVFLGAAVVCTVSWRRHKQRLETGD